MITPDLIPDEADEWLAASDAHSLDRIFLVAPSSTPERLAATVDASRGFVYAASTMGVTGARDAVSVAAPELVRRVKAVSDIPVGVGLGVRSREQAAQIGAYADGVIVGSALVSALDGGPAGGPRADRRTGRRCATEDFGVTTTILASFPSPPQGVWHLGPIPIRAYALCILAGVDRRPVHRRQAVGARGGEPGASSTSRCGPSSSAWSAVGSTTCSPTGRPTSALAARGSGRRSRSRRVALASGVRSHSAASARGSAADGGVSRCRRSATRSHPESFWRRRSAESGTTSTRSCSAATPRCRGVWRSSSASTPTARSTTLNGVSTGRLVAGRPPHVPVRTDLEPAGFRAADLGGPPLPDRPRTPVRACMSPHTASAGSGSS